MGWDPIRNVYVAHIESCLHRGCPLGKRITGRSESPDMIHWSEVETIMIPDDLTNNPIFLAQKAAPNIVETIRFSRQIDTNFAVVFDCMQKTTDEDGTAYLGAKAGGVLR